MPSQLVTNNAVYFICARNFTYGGVDYKMGSKFDQDIAVGQIDLLVRNRWLYAVVDDIADKPRHWHHHIHLASTIKGKLGLGEHMLNKPERVKPTKAEAREVEEETGLFDPAAHSTKDVLAYLETVDDDEKLRVLEAEESGKKRKGILDV